jgi:hypothetical protein
MGKLFRDDQCMVSDDFDVFFSYNQYIYIYIYIYRKVYTVSWTTARGASTTQQQSAGGRGWFVHQRS